MTSIWRLLPNAAPIAALVLAAACDGGASELPFLPETVTPSASPAQAPSPTATTPTAIGSYDDPNDFRSFAVELSQAIEAADVQFFLNNVTFEELRCDVEFPAPPESCAAFVNPKCEKNDPAYDPQFAAAAGLSCYQPGPVPGITVGVWQSEGFGLDAPAGYEEFIREFLTNVAAGSADAYGDAEPRLYAYGSFRSHIREEVPPGTVETVHAIASRIAGPMPVTPIVPGIPLERGVVLFGVTFDGQRWSITHLHAGPVAFLDPTGSGAETAGIEGVLQFWQRWQEGAAP